MSTKSSGRRESAAEGQYSYLYRGCMAWGNVYNEVFTSIESTGDSHGGPFQQYSSERANGVVPLTFRVRNRAF